MSILIVAEHNNTTTGAATFNTVTAASMLSADVHVLVAGKECGNVASELSAVRGVSRVMVADADAYACQLAENMAPLIEKISENYTHILAPATTFGKNILPRVAAMLNVDQVSDIISIESDDTFKRPVYAGNAIATVKSLSDKKVITVRSTAFDGAVAGDEHAPIETLDIVIDTGLSSFVSEKVEASERPELISASIVISGGRGLGSRENFEMLYRLADKLGAAVGASRAAVDAGFVPNDMQVGQTGKVVAPDLYIAIGISGAIQHLAGMKDAKTIVAINKDPEAPVFQVADYGLVADLFEVLPELTEKI